MDGELNMHTLFDEEPAISKKAEILEADRIKSMHADLALSELKAWIEMRDKEIESQRKEFDEMCKHQPKQWIMTIPLWVSENFYFCPRTGETLKGPCRTKLRITVVLPNPKGFLNTRFSVMTKILIVPLARREEFEVVHALDDSPGEARSDTSKFGWTGD